MGEVAEADLAFFRALFLRLRGWKLDADKGYLLRARLEPVAACHGVQGLSALADALRLGRDAALEAAVCDAMTIGETYFFRDAPAFEALEHHLIPKLREARRGARRLTIWSAACSTGQEPYSIAMLLADRFPELDGWDLRIVATDVNRASLEHARAGVYSSFEVQRGVPVRTLLAHFEPVGDRWRVSERVRRRVEFRAANLAQAAELPAGAFDVVLMRNVLIYFENATRARALELVRERLAPDGYLLLGGAETAVSARFRVAAVGVGAYQPV